MQIISPDFYSFRKWQLFLIYGFLYALVAWLTNCFVLNETFFYNYMGSTVSADGIKEYLAMRAHYMWFSYAALPVYIVIKIFVTAACIQAGALYFRLPLSWNQTVRVTLVAELALIIGNVLKFFWLLYAPPANDKMYFYFFPLSLTQLFRPQDVPGWWWYPLQTINLFEIAYWLLLAAGLKTFLGGPFKKMLSLVISSYGLALLIWLAFMVFVSLQLS